MTPLPARAGDLDAIRRLLADSGLPALDLTPAHLQHFLVIRDGADPVAVIGLEVRGTDALLRSAAVRPEFRRQGLGERLTRAAEAQARAAGLRRLYLLTTTAAAFFRRLGYADQDRAQVPAGIAASAEFRSLCPASAVCLSKAIDR